MFSWSGARAPPSSVESSDAPHAPGETKPRRNRKVAGKGGLLSRPHEKVQTAYDIVNWAADTFGDKHAFGTRVPGETENPYKYTTYREYQILVREVGSGLRTLGLVKPDKILIYAATSPQWLAVAHGASSQSLVFVTAYEALGPAGLEHSLESTGAKAIFVDRHLCEKVTSVLNSKALPNVGLVVYNDHTAVTTTTNEWTDCLFKLKDTRPGLRVVGFGELLETGRQGAVNPWPPTPEDLCAIYYTSGSTGVPKGVPVKHKAVTASVAGLDSIVGHHLTPKDSFLAYLPLAHVLEFAFENSCLFWGVTMGYGGARTLFDYTTPAGSVEKGDLRLFQPTFMIGVPAIWERIRKAILAKVDSGSLAGRTAFWAWHKAKKTWVASGLSGPADLNGTVSGAAAEVVGSRLRFAMSGGGPVAESTQHFMSMTMAPLINGYGLTETMAIGGLMEPGPWKTVSMSIPASIETKLVDYREAGYFSTNNPPQGEIWIRGDSVMEGYYDNSVDTASAIAPGGWLRTGDIGQWEPDGNYRIIDRKKNLVKTLYGEYIALEKLESVYRSATIVANICIHASPQRPKPIAIVIPSPPALRQLAQRHGLDTDAEVSKLSQHPNIISDALQQLQEVATAAGLVSIEKVEAVVLVEDPEWSPQNGLTTAVGKLNRRGIIARYREQIDRVYGES
ncbi:long-chain-fatty-acid-CoA ligase [Colletotrichum sojae]|uniref:Long-chain-fatty-acid-CoA ligase n=1 Tax=Colletotrichum sojae TaxID=2175907 RepID=A0A8H6IN32_9PEZI|nr:long-chain-fatty-acid-CoA ligase [Colletotrichum sojae]